MLRVRCITASEAEFRKGAPHGQERKQKAEETQRREL